jgi:hypothetical protein
MMAATDQQAPVRLVVVTTEPITGCLLQYRLSDTEQLSIYRIDRTYYDENLDNIFDTQDINKLEPEAIPGLKPLPIQN